MKLIANQDIERNLVFVTPNFLKLDLLGSNLSLITLLNPTQSLLDRVGNVQDYYQLLELNLTLFNIVTQHKKGNFGYNLDELSTGARLELNKLIVDRPSADECRKFILNAGDSNKFYVKGSENNLVLCLSNDDQPLSKGFVKLEGATLKEVLLNLFYKKFTYFDLHNNVGEFKTSEPGVVCVEDVYVYALNH